MSMGSISLRDVLLEIWNFQYAAIPCLFAYIVFDLPIIYRRITRRLYVPIYFAFFPFGYSDELYARYFNEDHYYTLGGPFKKSEVQNARLKIIWVSVLSLTLTMAISPFITAAFTYTFLEPTQQVQFFYTLAVVKAAMLLRSIYDLNWNYKVTDVIPIGYLAAIYVAYWIAILTFYNRSLRWIESNYLEGGLYLIGDGILDFFIFDIGVGVLFVAVIGFLIPWRLTNGTAQPEDD